MDIKKISLKKGKNSSVRKEKKQESCTKFDTKSFVESKIIDVEFGKIDTCNVLAYFVDKEGLKNALGGEFSNQLKNEIGTNNFEAISGKIANIGFIGDKKILFVGIGTKESENKKNKEKKDFNLKLEIQKAGAFIANYLPQSKNIILGISNEYCNVDGELLIDAYYGFNQKFYRFDKYITSEDTIKKFCDVEKVVLIDKNQKKLKNNEINEYQKLITEKQNKLQSIFYVRTFGNEPSNVLYPESFVKEIKIMFDKIKDITIKVLEETELKKLGMNMLLGVAQGSVNKPKVVVIEYNGNKKNKSYDLGLVGKGVCFDSGGLSLKPSQYMEGMKGDMLGSATVISTLFAIAKNNLKTNVVAVAGLVENMPDGGAQKVGDIVKSMSGKTVEIIDTDAEGRLVLGDILYYTQTKYKPKYLIDIATLTGAIMVALGLERAGIFTNNEDVGNKLKEIGNKIGEMCWVMPMGEEYSEAMKSQIADLRNLSTIRYAGSATAAAFLENFIDNNENWVHIDIAGVDNATKNNSFCNEGLATGYGVKLISDFVENNILK